MKSRGLGDSVEKLTRYTGIKSITKRLIKNCGCDARQDKLNKKFPYKK